MYTFLCARHEIVLAEGAGAESFYPGPQALKTGRLPRRAANCCSIFPELVEGITPFLPARIFASGTASGEADRTPHQELQTPSWSPVTEAVFRRSKLSASDAELASGGAPTTRATMSQ